MATNKDEPQRKSGRLARAWPFLRIGLIVVGVIVLGVVILLLISSVGHTAEWTGLKDFTDPTGQYHRGKTLWDWAELLIIPAVLGIGLWWLNHSARRNELKIAERRAETERQIAADRLQEETLQAYLDRMAELLLEKRLRDPETLIYVEVSDVARVRTLTVLRRLDGKRKGIVLRFLHESNLIQPTGEHHKDSIINMADADLSEADLRIALLEDADLSRANLRGADLTAAFLLDADLSGADLSGAILRSAVLNGADLRGAKLQDGDLRHASLVAVELGGANLSGADLSDANLNEAKIIPDPEQLAQAKSLKGATMPDGTKHD